MFVCLFGYLFVWLVFFMGCYSSLVPKRFGASLLYYQSSLVPQLSGNTAPYFQSFLMLKFFITKTLWYHSSLLLESLDIKVFWCFGSLLPKLFGNTALQSHICLVSHVPSLLVYY